MEIQRLVYSFNLVELLASGILLIMVLLESRRTRKKNYYLLSGVLIVAFLRALVLSVLHSSGGSDLAVPISQFILLNLFNFVIFLFLGPAILNTYVAHRNRVTNTIVAASMIFVLSVGYIYFFLPKIDIRELTLFYSVIFSIQLAFPLLALSGSQNFVFKMSGIDPEANIEDASLLKIPFTALLLAQIAGVIEVLFFTRNGPIVFQFFKWGMPALAYFGLLLVVYREIIDELHSNYNEAIHDKLTGLYNFGFLIKTLDSEISRAVRHTRPLSFLMLDLDHFKIFNDTYGHCKGDVLLIKVAETIESSIRKTDIAFRYGGEEFSVLLPETTLEEAEILAHRIKKNITKIEMGNGISASVGVSTLDNYISVNIDAPRELIVSADNALYEAKKAGKNAVVVATGQRLISKPKKSKVS